MGLDVEAEMIEFLTKPLVPLWELLVCCILAAGIASLIHSWLDKQ